MSLKKEDLQKADILLLDNLSEYKEEVANCSKFAELLSSGVDILVNDSFGQSHKILASTVGVARFCYASMAGFSFEENLHQLKKIAKTKKKPFIAIYGFLSCNYRTNISIDFCSSLVSNLLMQIGGGNLKNKAAALQFLASICDALVFVGQMSFPIMHALGHIIPINLVERVAHKAALDIVQFSHDKNVLMSCPTDFGV
ncbi:TSL-kinase interacting protein 1-like isoform X1 [Hibiscus syriacus]|uniref:Phosphoglycerate kinase n=2 Tax=Hibiscus syriacus TaxID=106335 RepID=A0A6A3BJM9_HIBSY|nr:TSL-kinase interacting protein 1-like isoform X1 [Hibiscus syriacus]